jgi:DNA processing protein
MKGMELEKLALNFIPNIGAVTARNLISYCGGLKEVFTAKKSRLTSIPGIGESKANDVVNGLQKALKIAEAELQKLDGKDIRILFYLDEGYPTKLKHYQDAPLTLYARGDMQLDATRCVAIVGTRKITSYGIVECEKLVEGLAAYNCTIISGLAYGVDTIAHRKAVELGIPTIGVLGNGINRIYPSTNKSLATKMQSKGGILSEYAMDMQPKRENFPRRNRVIAGMSDVVVIVESAAKGGSIITAEYANEYNKDVFAIPGRVGDEMSEGCNNLIKHHKAHLCTSAEDIADIMRWDRATEGVQMQLVMDLDEDERKLMQYIKEEPNIGLDSLHYKTKIPLALLTTTLLTLEFKGIVKPLPGKKYILAR